MFKKLSLILLALFFSSIAIAGQVMNVYTGKPDIIPTVTTQSGTPKIEACRVIKFTNGTVTDNGDTTCSVSTSSSLTTGDLTANSPLSFNNTRQVIGGAAAVSIANSAADGATKGAASFSTNDFDSSSGNISLDYTNGQAASSTLKGFLTSSDWTTFNNKAPTDSATFTTFIKIPNGTAPTVDAAGKIAQDTTDDQLLYGATPRVLSYKRDKDFLVESPSSSTNYLFSHPSMPVTITAVDCLVDGGTSAVVDIKSCNSNGASCSSILSATITCGTTNTTGTVSSGAITSGNRVQVAIGTVTGTVPNLSVHIDYTLDRQ